MVCSVCVSFVSSDMPRYFAELLHSISLFFTLICCVSYLVFLDFLSFLENITAIVRRLLGYWDICSEGGRFFAVFSVRRHPDVLFSATYTGAL